jgi:ABC-type polysaccharide transport system permease subunit
MVLQKKYVGFCNMIFLDWGVILQIFENQTDLKQMKKPRQNLLFLPELLTCVVLFYASFDFNTKNPELKINKGNLKN